MAEVKPPPPPTIPIKRKRKSTNSGASNDCFACLKRGSICDRVRPYCGPCLAVGQECSGYKTVLTWGVGVASRGKLRGKTLPVQKSATAAPLPTSSKPQVAAASQHHSQTGQTPETKQDADLSSPQRPHKRQRTASDPYAPYQDHAYTQFPHKQPEQYQHFANYGNPQPAFQVQINPSNNAIRPYNEGSQPSPAHQDMHRLQTSDSYMHDNPPSASSTASQTSAAYPYPSPYDERNQHLFSPHHPDDQRFGNSFIQTNSFPGFRSPGRRPILNNYDPRWDARPDAMQPPMPPDDPRGSQTPITTPLDGPQSPLAETPFVEKTASSFAWDPYTLRIIEEEAVEDDIEASSSSTAFAPSISRSSVTLSFPELTGRMRRVMDYYDKAICPFLVATDGPRNPYRMHVIQMAVQSPGLQNAIAALITNNARMRQICNAPEFMEGLRARARRDSMDIVSPPGRASIEEQSYKAKSIELLNTQLTSGDKRIAASDTVLASLVVLCLYHVCNSGFSKFKTQLAGVQKVLRMRSKESRSGFTCWVEMFFAWLDVMTSAVNDRETEIRGDSLAMADFSADLGPLEEFSGCDGRLFKLIARLGRLNLLSQNRPVRPAEEPLGDEREPSPSTSDFGKDFYAPSFEEVGRRRSTSPNIHRNDLSRPSPPSERQPFWREWKDIRSRLHDWQMRGPIVDMANDGYTTLTKQQTDMMQLSDAFRYSALLYVERLAFPDLPSSSPDLQDLVEKSLAYIEGIGQGSSVLKFMLWPLFITGTECVQERHRNLIRARCIEIQQESGFFNNVTGLRVLERVWRDADAGVPAKPSQTFRWRSAMDRLDGEYIVI